MKNLLLLFSLLSFNIGLAQETTNFEKAPVFPECESQPVDDLKACFNNKINQFIYGNFKVPEKVTKDGYTGEIKILFEVDDEGEINVIYTDAVYEELKLETQRVFDSLPKVQPGTYNGKPTYFQYALGVKIPLVDPAEVTSGQMDQLKTNTTDITNANLNEDVSAEFDSVNIKTVPYQKLEYSSQLNIPFTHNYYARFDQELNGLGTNSHTAAKPFIYQEVAQYYDFKAEKKDLVKGSDAWWNRKLWDEHLVAVQGKDYWFTVDPILDLQVGKDSENGTSTFNNTRGIWVQAGLGKKFNFSTSIYESQGRFADYYNNYIESIRASVGEPIVPGRGVSKRFKEDAYDYPVAEGYLTYSPVDFLNIQFGHGKNFIGDGYRSLLQSDVSSPYPFVKLNTKFWKIKYTNTWMSLRDVRAEVLEDGAFLTKYMANHYLSWNVSKRLNIGLFESVLWTDANNRGFDLNYLNPVIFYRAIEFETGQNAGNAILGASGKYKWNNKVNIYGQFILDEFSLTDITGGNKSWKNKFGYQLGVKYFDAFKVDNLLLQFEYNRVRPYTYSHNTIVLNYAHNNQPMAHLWGANFSEAILIGRYNYRRWYADAKLIFGKRGFDFDTEEDSFFYGGDIYGDERDRNANTGITVGQGNQVNVFQFDLQAGYVVNTATNLRLFTNLTFRNFNPEAITESTVESNTVWFNIGLRTSLFNWYNDF
ncbi:hypothetical protein [Sediminibacter sp. Hel_I_10]|uniref:hypothetical protein n=1 Tax=Sediminibacter sp. Hel_I_10 TaxID=1392490 RepID=UPI00047BAA17|nr:hypothetical protein [Sediminibacter sp. Hel_I_10]